jgi:type II secretory pathway component GspD/PulD (secretin)
MRLAVALVFVLGACGGSQKGPADLVEADAWDDLDEVEADDEVRPTTRPVPVAQPAIYEPMPERATSQRRYRGTKIDLDLKGADLHNVFRLLADVGGVNIVVSDEIKGTVTMRLKQVPWDQALHAIVRAKQLTLEEDQGLYLVMPKRAGR